MGCRAGLPYSDPYTCSAWTDYLGHQRGECLLHEIRIEVIMGTIEQHDWRRAHCEGCPPAYVGRGMTGLAHLGLTTWASTEGKGITAHCLGLGEICDSCLPRQQEIVHKCLPFA